MAMKWWGDFRTSQFRDLDPHSTIAVLPLAAIEQHGPHLPVSTDTTIMQGLLDAAFAQVPESLDVRVLPIQAVGASAEHDHLYGTLSYPAVEALGIWQHLLNGVAITGIRKLVIVNAHGGNEPAMGLLALQARKDHRMMAVKTSWERFGTPDGLFDPAERRTGIHGGDYETSLMLHLRPDLVDMAAARDFASATGTARQTFKHLAPQSPHAFAWCADDLNAEGVVGNAAAATAEKGRLAAEHQARGFVELLHDVAAARLDDWLAG